MIDIRSSIAIQMLKITLEKRKIGLPIFNLIEFDLRVIIGGFFKIKYV